MGGNNGATYYSGVFYDSVSSAGAGSTWTESIDYGAASGSTGAGGVKATGISCAVNNGYVYCVGGYTGSAYLSKVFYAQLSATGGVTGSGWTETYDYGCTSACGTTGGGGVAIGFASCIPLVAGSSTYYIDCVGGYTSSSAATSKVFYDTATSSGVGATWTETTDYGCISSCSSNGSTGTSMAGVSCAITGSGVYCVGGVSPPGSSGSSRVFWATLSNGAVSGSAWTATYDYGCTSSCGTTGGTGTPIMFSSCYITGGYLYCVDGRQLSGGSVISKVFFDQVSSGVGSAWTESVDYGEPTANSGNTGVSVSQLSCAVSGAYVYCVGGQMSSGATVSQVWSAQNTPNTRYRFGGRGDVRELHDVLRAGTTCGSQSYTLTTISSETPTGRRRS